MSTLHCTDDVLIAKLYGLDVGSSDALHLNGCAVCAGRLDAMADRRRQAAGQSAVSDDVLREQRARIHARIEDGRRLSFWLRPAPAVAVALVIAAGLMFRPIATAPTPVQTASTESDAQFFSEIATVADQQEPRAADPIRGLFDEAATK